VIVRSIILFAFFLPTFLYPQRVRVGAEILLEKHLHLLEGKRIGLLCNHTSVLPDKKHLVDTLLARGVNVTALFSPEHGIRGTVPHGVIIGDTIDENTGLKVYSLYGKRRKPSKAMVSEIDILMVDLQDVGARFYTYSMTMSDAMEAAFEHSKPFIVLDRPNPINGVDVEGPLLDSSLQSGVGRFPLPIRHGMTMGELARMFSGEGWIGSGSTYTPKDRQLTVIPMENWHRAMWFDETRLPWISPSPNMKYFSTAIVYPGSCLLEATNLSEGRGTFKPFEYFGAPWLNNSLLAKELNSLDLPGVRFHPIIFTPQSTSQAPSPKYLNQRCNGIFIQVKDRRVFRPVTTALKILETLHETSPSMLAIDSTFFDKLLGTDRFRTSLLSGRLNDSLITAMTMDVGEFLKVRKKYLLY